MPRSITAAKRRRRTSEEVRRAILELARELFDEKGYDGTTTADLAAQAGVSSRLIFSHFGSKEELFNAAVVAPFVEVITAYVDAWMTDTQEQTPEERIRYWVEGLYDLAREHRTALLTALAAKNAPGSNAHQDVLDDLAQAFQKTVTIRRSEGYENLDMAASLATSVGMIFGVALLDDVTFPTGTRRPGRQRLIDEMHTTLLDGVRNRPHSRYGA